MKVLLAVIVTALVCAGTAVGVNEAVTPRQFTKLQKRVTQLEGSQAAVINYLVNCLGAFYQTEAEAEDGSPVAIFIPYTQDTRCFQTAARRLVR